MWDYSDGIKEQTEERPNAALGDRPNFNTDVSFRVF